MLIGSHQSISKSIDLSIKRALADNCECLQVFVKNNNRWEGKNISDEEAEKFRNALADSGLKVCCHATYLINLATNKDEVYEKSMFTYKDELSRCDRLNIPYYVIHPGSHLGEGLDYGISKISKSIDMAYGEGYDCMTLLEMTAGQGSGIGSSIDHMLGIMEASENSDKIGICLDSAHIYAAGYDIKDNYEEVFRQMFDAFGDKIKVFHLNDSKKALGTRVDRHELVGKGEIGSDFFKKVVNDPRFDKTLGILETPVEVNYKKEIELLKSFRH